MASKVGLGERIRAYIRERIPSVGKDIDVFLSERLPDYAVRNNIAGKNELQPIEKIFSGLEERMDDLDTWKGDTNEKTEEIRTRVERLERKYNLKV